MGPRVPGADALAFRARPARHTFRNDPSWCTHQSDVGSINRLNKSSHRFVVLLAWLRFHTTCYIHAKWMERANGVRNIFWIQSARKNDLSQGVLAERAIPVDRPSGAWRTSIEKKSSAAVAAESIHAESRIHAERLDYFHPLNH